ncbi:MAG: type II secretion system protein [Candidatus Paceibacterota bacterium]|jgi:prepilin-type N-terminal cleavage/methylation domain-containing protein
MKKSGFTLIELLVVIAIIAILTSIVMTNFSSSRSRARDAKRVSDLGQIQLALELYFDRCKEYPGSFSTSANNGCPSGISLITYISQIPSSPSPGSYGYHFNDNTVPYNPNDYVLHVTLENQNEVTIDGRQNISGIVYPTPLPTCNQVKEYCIGPK